MVYQRPSWDEYFIEVMHALKKRATCDRGRSACIIVRDNQILVSGYVGSPPGLPHCDEVGHMMKTVIHEDGHKSFHCTRTLHAEQNAICQAAKRGVSLQGATLYVSMTPCRTCAMLMISVGIKRCVSEYKYHSGQETEDMFKEVGLQLDYIHTELNPYEGDARTIEKQ